jgi:hypothetical protein
MTNQSETQNIVRTNLVGVDGWLGFFCVMLGILSPFTIILSFAFQIAQWPTGQVIVRYPQFISILLVDMIANLSLATYSVYAGYSLWRIRPNAVAIAKRALIAYLVCPLLLMFVDHWLYGDLPSRATDTIYNANMQWFGRNLIPVLIWLRYLMVSKRISNTYGTQISGLDIPPNRSLVTADEACRPESNPVQRPVRPVPEGFRERHRRLRQNDQVFHPLEGCGIVVGQGRDRHFVCVRFEENPGENQMDSVGLYL